MENSNPINAIPPREQFSIHEAKAPGYRFVPTDSELIHFYLLKKIDNQTVPLLEMTYVEIKKYAPEQLAAMHEKIGQDDWYFFTSRDRKYQNGSRPDRKAGDGFWKASGPDSPIQDEQQSVIGFKKTLVYYKGSASKPKKTNWIMHEYKAANRPSRPPPSQPSDKNKQRQIDMTLDDCVLCRIHQTLFTRKKKTNQNGDQANAPSGEGTSYRNNNNIVANGTASAHVSDNTLVNDRIDNSNSNSNNFVANGTASDQAQLDNYIPENAVNEDSQGNNNIVANGTVSIQAQTHIYPANNMDVPEYYHIINENVPITEEANAATNTHGQYNNFQAGHEDNTGINNTNGFAIQGRDNVANDIGSLHVVNQVVDEQIGMGRDHEDKDVTVKVEDRSQVYNVPNQIGHDIGTILDDDLGNSLNEMIEADVNKFCTEGSAFWNEARSYEDWLELQGNVLPNLDNFELQYFQENFQLQQLQHPQKNFEQLQCPQENFEQLQRLQEDFQQLQLLQENIEQSQRPQESFQKLQLPQENFAQLQRPQENFRQLQLPKENFEQLQLPRENIQQLQLPQENFQQLQLPHENIQQLQLPQENFQQLQLPQENFQQLQHPQKNFQQLQRPPDNFFNGNKRESDQERNCKVKKQKRVENNC